MSDPPPTDPAALEEFPTVELDPTVELWRVHRFENRPEYFTNSGLSRFDPPRHSRNEYGVCYMATSQVGAFLETLGRFRPLPLNVVRERALTPLHLTGAVRLASVNDPAVLGHFGISGDLSVGADYELPQQWSAALRAAGFDGIYYRARHDPALEESSVALFGDVGVDVSRVRAKKGWDLETIPDSLLDFVERRYGIYALPPVLGH
jgi:hypothetical protein